MGWFLTSSKGGKKRKTKSRSARRSAADPKPWDPQRTLLALKILGGIAAAVAVIVGWNALETHLLDYASGRYVGDVPAERVVIHKPAWMSAGTESELQRLIAREVGIDSMAPAGLAIAADKLMQTGWVRDVRQVSRASDGTIHVEAEFRDPVAVVQARPNTDRYHLVDGDGIRLPGEYRRRHLDALPLPQIAGVAEPAPLYAGNLWSGADLRAALELAVLIRGESFAPDIRAIDVSRRDNRNRVQLVMHTERGEIIWGLPARDGLAIEEDPQVKLSRLRRVVKAKGSVDAGGQLVIVNGPEIYTTRMPLRDANQTVQAP